MVHSKKCTNETKLRSIHTCSMKTDKNGLSDKVKLKCHKILCFNNYRTLFVFSGLTGSSQKCDNEGEVFPLPVSILNPCFTCLCKVSYHKFYTQHCSLVPYLYTAHR